MKSVTRAKPVSSRSEILYNYFLELFSRKTGSERRVIIHGSDPFKN